MHVVHAFPLPQRPHRVPGHIVAQSTDLTDRHPLSRRGHRTVGGVTALTELESAGFGAGRVELAKRLAEAQEIDLTVGHGISNH